MSAAKPIKMDGSRIISTPLAVLLAIAGTLIATAVAAQRYVGRLETVEQRGQETAVAVKTNSEKISRMEIQTAADIREIKTDVKWVKDALGAKRVGKLSETAVPLTANP